MVATSELLMPENPSPLSAGRTQMSEGKGQAMLFLCR